MFRNITVQFAAVALAIGLAFGLASFSPTRAEAAPPVVQSLEGAVINLAGCLPELTMQAGSTLRLVSHETSDANGGIHSAGTLIIQGKAVDEENDDVVYTVVNVQPSSFNLTASGGEQTVVAVVRISQQGAGNVYSANVRVHITLTPSGQLNFRILNETSCTF